MKQIMIAGEWRDMSEQNKAMHEALESIAQTWDGCEVDVTSVGAVYVGEALRKQFSALSQPAQSPVAVPEGYRVAPEAQEPVMPHIKNAYFSGATRKLTRVEVIHDGEIVTLYAAAPANVPQPSEQTDFERCDNPSCGRFKDGAGWGCRAMRDGACTKDEVSGQPVSDAVDERCPNCKWSGRRYVSHGANYGENLACDLCASSYIREAILDAADGADIDMAVIAASQKVEKHFSSLTASPQASEQDKLDAIIGMKEALCSIDSLMQQTFEGSTCDEEMRRKIVSHAQSWLKHAAAINAARAEQEKK